MLVALPADLPFHYYAAQRGLAVPIGGQPEPGERLFLVVRPDDSPCEALEHNQLLLFTEAWILEAEWEKWREFGQLTIYEARTVAQPGSQGADLLPFHLFSQERLLCCDQDKGTEPSP